MFNERHFENYKGQEVIVYGSGDKWNYMVITFDFSDLSQVKVSEYFSRKTYLTKEEAIANARKFVDSITRNE